MCDCALRIRMGVVTVDAERLRVLNNESAACLERWKVRVAESDELGRYLLSETGVPAGEVVMVLPPNRILAFSEVEDYNTVIQARTAGIPRCRPFHA